MHYLIYKTTNLVNGKYYLGQHQTKNKDDTYLGSGKLLLQAIKKYGNESFKREILYECSSVDEMNQKEKEIVTQEEVSNPECYNARIGGEGGWTHWVGTEGHKASTKRGGANSGVRERNVKLTTEECRRRFEIGLKRWRLDNPDKLNDHKSDKFKKEQSERFMGVKNPMYGKCWVFNPVSEETKLIDKELLHEYENNGWNQGKRMRNKTHNYGKCWVTKNGINKFIKRSEIEIFLHDGYIRGRIM